LHGIQCVSCQELLENVSIALLLQQTGQCQEATAVLSRGSLRYSYDFEPASLCLDVLVQDQDLHTK
jgi:hypothetical protein